MPTTMFTPSASATVSSPCIGVCRLDATGHCEGCHRSVAEIAAWARLDETERQRLMGEVLPQRARERR